MPTALLRLWPLANYNLQDDGFGNLIVVLGHSWASAHYVSRCDQEI